MLDTAKNFAKGTVSTGYTATDTSIVLSAGNGVRFPVAPFNAVWWNSTDYPDPSDDPNVEIVRVTAVATDTLTVTRAQEGTTASTKNTAGKTYKMLAGLTATVINDKLQNLFFAMTAPQAGDSNVTAGAFATGFKVPANTFKVGTVLRFYADGVYNFNSTVNNNLEFDFSANGTVIGSTGAPFQGSNVTGSYWAVEVIATCTAVGTSGTLMLSVRRFFPTGASSNQFNFNGDLLPPVSATINTTVDQTFAAYIGSAAITATQNQLFGEVKQP